MAIACVMCDIANDAPDTPFVQLFEGDRKTADQVVARASSVFVCVDSAPVVPGHCMLVTMRHVPSFATASWMELHEAMFLAEEIEKRLNEVGEVAYFEHGPSVNLTVTAGCGINHAHLHALPVQSRHFEALLREREFERIAGLPALGPTVGEGGYIYLKTRALGSAVVRVHCDESQVVRRALATSIGQGHVANWHDQLVFAEAYDTRGVVEMSLAMLRELPRPPVGRSDAE